MEMSPLVSSFLPIGAAFNVALATLMVYFGLKRNIQKIHLAILLGALIGFGMCASLTAMHALRIGDVFLGTILVALVLFISIIVVFCAGDNLVLPPFPAATTALIITGFISVYWLLVDLLKIT